MHMFVCVHAHMSAGSHACLYTLMGSQTHHLLVSLLGCRLPFGGFWLFTCLFLVCVCLAVTVCVYSPVPQCTYGGQESIFRSQFHHVGPRSWTQVVRLGSRAPLPAEPFSQTLNLFHDRPCSHCLGLTKQAVSAFRGLGIQVRTTMPSPFHEAGGWTRVLMFVW